MLSGTDELSFELLDTALNAAQDGIFIYKKDSRVLYANKSAFELCGLDKNLTIGKTWRELERAGYFHGEAALTCIRSKRRVSAEFTNRIGRHLLSTATPVFDSEGKLQFVVTNLRDITNLFELQRELAERKQQLNKVKKKLDKLQNQQGKDFVYASSRMRKILETLDRVACTDVSVLLLGESGVGKSELAERIHRNSGRSSGSLIVVNCGAIPPSLCEAEFFGYEKGAFTGAEQTKPGIFECADGGTLVLDEIGELSLSIQVKLLRVLQEGRVKRLGSQREVPVNVRLVAATNQNIKDMVAAGTFREDLYHRINVIQFFIPPLRERPEDVKRLLSYFLARYNRKYGMAKTMSPQLVSALERYSWPGNSREMAHLIERMVVLSTTEEMTCEYLPEELGETSPGASRQVLVSLEEAVKNAERELLRAARQQLGNTRNMAKVLNVSHVTVARKLKQYGIE